MAMYGYTINSVTIANTTNDLLTLVPAANRLLQVVEISICGLGTASAANVLGVYRSTGGATGSGAVTGSPAGRITSSEAPAAALSAFTGWTTQPTTATQYLALGVNANGGIYRWVARPGEELYCASTSDMISFRAASGSSTICLHVLVMEDAI